MRFAEHDTTEENFRLLWKYLERWGRPVEFYTDKDSTCHGQPAAEGGGGRGLARGFNADRAGTSRAGDRLGAGPLATGQGAGGALLWDGPGPAW